MSESYGASEPGRHLSTDSGEVERKHTLGESDKQVQLSSERQYSKLDLDKAGESIIDRKDDVKNMGGGFREVLLAKEYDLSILKEYFKDAVKTSNQLWNKLHKSELSWNDIFNKLKSVESQLDRFEKELESVKETQNKLSDKVSDLGGKMKLVLVFLSAILTAIVGLVLFFVQQALLSS